MHRQSNSNFFGSYQIIMKTVIITGANGFIGSSLVHAFFEKGFRVCAIVKDREQEVSHIKGEAEIFYCEMDGLDDLVDKFAGDAEIIVYHLAWQGVNGSDKGNIFVQRDNISMALNCAAFAKKIGASKFLCAGTVAENAVNSFAQLERIPGGLFYAAAKKCARIMLEAYCKNIGLNFVWMQFSNIFGPNNKTGNLISYTLTQLTNNEKATFGPADQPYDFIYIDDLINAVVLLGTKNTQKSCYFIGSGKPKLLKEYLKEIGDCCGKPEKIGIGERPDDGIKYTYEMFDTTSLVNDIGEYCAHTFETAIQYTIENF